MMSSLLRSAVRYHPKHGPRGALGFAFDLKSDFHRRPVAMAFPMQTRHLKTLDAMYPPSEFFDGGEETWAPWKPEVDGPFFCKNMKVEPLKYYRKGGYHPVHLEDVMHRGRYTILNKLGWGRDGTVWLAKDSSLKRDVAVKVFKSTAEAEHWEELKVHTHLKAIPISPKERRHIVKLIDCFEIRDPNGRHPTLVFETLGPDLYGCRLSYKDAWEVARQLVQAVAYIHSKAVTHGNLRLQKVMLANTFNIEHILRPTTQAVQPVDKDGYAQAVHASETSPQVPQYLVDSAKSMLTWKDGNMRFHVNTRKIPRGEKGLKIKLTGFGKNVPARALDYPPQRFDDGLIEGQAPEIEFGEKITSKADIWSLGLMIFELITGRQLIGEHYEFDFELIDQWIRTFDELPEEWSPHTPWKDPADHTQKQDIRARMYRDGEIAASSDPVLERLVNLLESMLRYRPDDRPSASEILQHPWLREYQAPTIDPWSPLQGE